MVDYLKKEREEHGKDERKMGIAKIPEHERCVIGSTDPILEKEHVERYEFAKGYVRDRRVLDVSCGSGYGSHLLSDEAAEVIGVDISEEALKLAGDRYQAPNLSFVQADATCLDCLGECRFDVVVSFETIEHIPDYGGFLQEVKRVLRDDGLFIVSTPNRLIHSPHSRKPVNPFHVIEFDYHEFTALLGRDFRIMEMYGQNLQNPGKKAIRAVAKLVPSKLKDPVKRAVFGRQGMEPLRSTFSSGFTATDAERCKYFIAICDKL